MNPPASKGKRWLIVGLILVTGCVLVCVLAFLLGGGTWLYLNHQPTARVLQPMCTPPVCQPGEVYACAGACPGGCGTGCATVTP